MTAIPQRVSLVAQTADLLRRDLQSGLWRESLPGEIPLARRLHVGRPTVRAALGLLQREGWVGVSQGRRRRVLRRTSDRPPRSRTNVVAILTPAHSHDLSPFRLYLLSELQSPLHDAGYRVEIHPHIADAKRNPSSSLDRLVSAVRADCWVLMGPHPSIQRWFAQRNIPCLGAGATPDEVLIPYLRVDYRAASRHAVGTLLHHGHTRIALLLAHSWKQCLEIRTGFNEGCSATSQHAGVHPLVFYYKPTVEGIQAMIRTQVFAQDRPHALITTDPRHTLTVLSQLFVSGWQVPRDVSLVSLGHDAALDSMVPSVARYAIDRPAFARKLARMALNLVRTGCIPVRETLMVPLFQTGGTLGERMKQAS